jgi:hypothetical protein
MTNDSRAGEGPVRTLNAGDRITVEGDLVIVVVDGAARAGTGRQLESQRR